MSDELINHRLTALEDDRQRAAAWREATTKQIAELSASVQTALALGAQRMNAIDEHLEATDAAVIDADGKASAAHAALRATASEVAALSLESKRDPRAFYTAIGSGVAALAAGFVAYFKGTP